MSDETSCLRSSPGGASPPSSPPPPLMALPILSSIPVWGFVVGVAPLYVALYVLARMQRWHPAYACSLLHGVLCYALACSAPAHVRSVDADVAVGVPAVSPWMYWLPDWPVHVWLPLATLFYLCLFRLTRAAAVARKLSPTYYCSLVHIGSTLLLSSHLVACYSYGSLIRASDVAARLTLIQSLAYFAVDTVWEPDRSWLLHHVLVFTQEGSVLFMGRRFVGAAALLGWAECGAFTYHLSCAWPRSKAVRIAFLVVFGLSRVAMLPLNIVQWQDNWVLYLEHGFMSATLWACVFEALVVSATVYINVLYMRTQLRTYHKHFGVNGTFTKPLPSPDTIAKVSVPPPSSTPTARQGGRKPKHS